MQYPFIFSVNKDITKKIRPMSAINSLSASRNEDLLSPFVSALVIVLFLFYIDEGYYNFRWMLDWGSWIVFGIYMLIFFPIQGVISHFVFGTLTGWKKIGAMLGIGLPLTYFFFWIVF